MTGAPRLRSMEIIDRLEASARGIYSGTLGYLSLSGTADLNIVIRTLVCRDGELTAGVGGAITVDSIPEEEVEEAHLKGRVLVQAVERAAASHGRYRAGPIPRAPASSVSVNGSPMSVASRCRERNRSRRPLCTSVASPIAVAIAPKTDV